MQPNGCEKRAQPGWLLMQPAGQLASLAGQAATAGRLVTSKAFGLRARKGPYGLIVIKILLIVILIV